MIFVHLSGVRGSFTSVDDGFSGDTANPLYALLTDTLAEGANWTPNQAFLAGNTEADLASLIAPGNWFHLFLSVDFSLKDGLIISGDDGIYSDPDNTKRVWLLINGQDFGLGGPPNPVLYDGTIPGNVPNNGYCITGIVGGGTIKSAWQAGVDGEYGEAKFEVPAWEIAINGNEFAIPAAAENAASGFNPRFRIADFRMWLDRYVDPNEQFDKFVTIADGFGTPANPSVAIDAFGSPTYSISGPASTIGTNPGTGGDLAKTGTVTDVVGSPVRFAV
jgi:hypothetical protein